MYTEIKKCRICEKTELITVLSLGNQYLTGVFPKSITEKVTRGPLDMVWCTNCGLLQMKQSYSSEEMYGDNYGYRSGLNSSMVKHLQQKIGMLESLVKLAPTDLMVDIGSNDATLLKACSGKYKKVEIDPTGNKFKKYYTKDMVLISDFFSASVFKKYFLNKKAKLITAIAMFYDLEDPKAFVRDIEKCLSADGIWHFEQSYMPSMLRTNAYDTICHEHLEFYSFRVVKNLLENCGMRVIDVQMNSINGGSFAVTACKKNANYSSNKPIINWLLKQEKDMGLETPKPYRDFEEKVYRHRENLKELIKTLVKDGKLILYSNKGGIDIEKNIENVKKLIIKDDKNLKEIANFLEVNIEFLEKLEKEVKVIIQEAKIKNKKLAGKTFVLTGSLESMSRDEAKKTFNIHEKNILVDGTKGIQYLNETFELINEAFIKTDQAVAQRRVTGLAPSNNIVVSCAGKGGKFWHNQSTVIWPVICTRRRDELPTFTILPYGGQGFEAKCRLAGLADEEDGGSLRALLDKAAKAQHSALTTDEHDAR